LRIYLVGSGLDGYSRVVDRFIADAWKKEGHDVIEADIYGLLDVWQKAARAIGAGDFWDEETLERALGWLHEELREFRPHLFLVIHGHYVPRSLVAAARRAGAVCVLWATTDPYSMDVSVECACRGYDLVLTVEKAAVSEYREAGLEAVYMPFACCPEFHRPVEVPKRYNSEVLFVRVGHSGRVELLSSLADMLPERKIRAVGERWEGFEKTNVTVEKGPAEPVETVRWYSGARVVLNLHSEDTEFGPGNMKNVPAESPNVRLFEIAACGVYQIADNRPGISALGVPTFNTIRELAEKIEFALCCPEEAKKKAAELRQTVLEKHTYRHRVQGIAKMIGKRTAGISTVVVKDIRYYRNVNPAVLEAVPSDTKRLLDVGCGSGTLGAALKERNPNMEIIGVEINPLAAREASAVLDNVIVADVEAGNLPLDNGYFDCIVCGDVLEHLRDPWTTVEKLKVLLKNGGVMIASLPNVGHVSVITDLLAGRWRYVEAGILDSTHLRFFTRETAAEMFERAGMVIEQIKGILWNQNDMEKVKEIQNALDRRVNVSSDAAYAQFLVVARKGDGGRW